MADIQSIRKKNLKALIAQWEGPTNLAKKLQYSGPSYLSQMIGPGKPITEKTARYIEQTLELPTGWMDQEHKAKPTNGKVDRDMLANAALHVMSEAADAGLNLSPARMSQLLTFVWECTAQLGKIDDDFIRRLIKLLKED